jgi:hypothetical protein
MSETSIRRLAENELLFRHANAKIKARQKQAYDANDDELIIQLYCECSNRNCHERIAMSVQDYEEAHKNNRQFIALPHHEDPAIEQIIAEEAGFNVIQKYVDPVGEVA